MDFERSRLSMKDIYIWGDSHWRVFFRHTNHGAPGPIDEFDGIRTIDMCANELSGSTMWGLLNESSKNGARRRILSDLKRIGPVDYVGLTFGEVDARYHNLRYFSDEFLSEGRIVETVSRLMRFVFEDLFQTGLVRKQVFIYHGYLYPQLGETLLQPWLKIGDGGYQRATFVNEVLNLYLRKIFWGFQAVSILSFPLTTEDVSSDGVHLLPERTFERIRQQINERILP